MDDEVLEAMIVHNDAVRELTEFVVFGQARPDRIFSVWVRDQDCIETGFLWVQKANNWVNNSIKKMLLGQGQG